MNYRVRDCNAETAEIAKLKAKLALFEAFDEPQKYVDQCALVEQVQKTIQAIWDRISENHYLGQNSDQVSPIYNHFSFYFLARGNINADIPVYRES